MLAASNAIASSIRFLRCLLRITHVMSTDINASSVTPRMKNTNPDRDLFCRNPVGWPLLPLVRVFTTAGIPAVSVEAGMNVVIVFIWPSEYDSKRTVDRDWEGVAIVLDDNGRCVGVNVREARIRVGEETGTLVGASVRIGPGLKRGVAASGVVRATAVG